MHCKSDNDSEEEETNSLNTIFILKDGNYSLTSGRIYLKRKKSVRLIEILRDPNLAEACNNNNNLFLTNTRLYNSNKIIIKNPIFGERYIDISTIVIAYEKQADNITDAEIKEIDNNSFYKKENVSLSTKDNHSSEFKIKGESFGIKSILNDDLNHNQEIFIYLTNSTFTDSYSLINNSLIKISQSWDMLINLKYFKLE